MEEAKLVINQSAIRSYRDPPFLKEKKGWGRLVERGEKNRQIETELCLWLRESLREDVMVTSDFSLNVHPPLQKINKK